MLDDVIARLQSIRSKAGNLPVVVNGEYGISGPKMCTDDMISCGEARLLVDGVEYLPVEETDLVVHVGDC
jgi:hypothetical protein